jgi:hypothetical protein
MRGISGKLFELGKKSSRVPDMRRDVRGLRHHLVLLDGRHRRKAIAWRYNNAFFEHFEFLSLAGVQLYYVRLYYVYLCRHTKYTRVSLSEYR